MKRIFTSVLAGCSLLIATVATAQDVQQQDVPKQDIQRHELSIYSVGGYSPISYTLGENGSKSAGIGSGAGVGYTFNISPAIGIVTGIELTTYNAEVSFDNTADNYNSGAGEHLLLFSYSLSNYKEKQKVTLFSIPVMAQYSLPLGGSSTRFYASGGLKLGLPVGEADITPGTATTKGEYSHEKVTYVGLPQHGFVSNASLPGIKKDIDLNFAAALALETGVSFTLTDKLLLYTGAYFDCGLNSIQKVNDKYLLEYDASNESTFKYNIVINTGLADKVRLVSAGLKLRVSLKL
jgi:hypothetical protein